jgi:hypothetical protein
LSAADTSDNLPALVGADAVEPRREGNSLIPTIPDVTKAAARWLRPFVPPIIASAIDTTTKPLRSARQVFEETEEIHLTRTHRVSVQYKTNRSAAAEPGEPRGTSVGDVQRSNVDKEVRRERDAARTAAERRHSWCPTGTR